MPNDFISRYGEYTDYELDLIKKRAMDLWESYKEFKSLAASKASAKGFDDVGFGLNKAEFLKIPFLYVNDLKEYKTFHDATGGTDYSKRAAYIARQIALVRPIEIENEINARQELLDINAQFAVFVFQSYSNVPQKKDNAKFAKMSEELLFVFQFRDPQRELLALISKLIGGPAVD